MLTASLPSAHRFRWLKDGELFGSETEGSGTMRGDNSSLDMLEGEYRCYASNSLGTAMTQTVKVNVERESQTYCRHKGRQCALRFTPADAQMSHDHIKSHTHFSESVRLIGATCSLISSCHGNHFPATALWRHSGGRMYGGCGGWSRWLRSACTQMKYYTVLALSDLTSAVVLNSFRFYFLCFVVRFTSIISCFSTSQFIDTDWTLLCDFQRTIVLN